MGRLDELPEEIIHRIQSDLFEGDAVRSLLLCKSWLHAHSTLPSLRFLQHTSQTPSGFIKLVDDALQSCRCRDPLAVQNVDFWVQIAAGPGDKEEMMMESCVRRWLELLAQMRNKHLSLAATVRSPFTVPLDIIFSSQALRILSITLVAKARRGQGQLLRYPCNPTVVRCFSLQVLKLYKVHITDKLMADLISSCRSLQQMTLSWCRGFQRIHIHADGHPLRVFEFQTDLRQEKEVFVQVDAPNLERFVYHRERVPPSSPSQYKYNFNINVHATTNHITRFQLHGVKMEDAPFQELMSRFRLLKLLEVRRNDDLKRIQMDLVFPNLTRLCISLCSQLKDIQVDAPKLVEFHYVGGPLTSLEFPGTDPEQLRAHLNYAIVENSHLSWLSKALLVSRKMSLEVDHITRLEDFTLHGDGDGGSGIPVMELAFPVRNPTPFDTDRTRGSLDALLRLCHPRYITVWRDDPEFCELLLTELVDRRRLGSLDMLLDVQVSLVRMVVDEDEPDEDRPYLLMTPFEYPETKEELLTVPRENMLDMSERYIEYEFIRFTLTWSGHNYYYI